MNVNGINNNHIDTANANNVTASLLSALEKKSVDYSGSAIKGFTRQTLGVDLYSQKTDLNFQRQIALTNAGLAVNNMNLNSVKALNALAAQASYSANITEAQKIDNVEDIINSIDVYSSEADKKDSNPFTFANFFKNSEKEEA